MFSVNMLLLSRVLGLQRMVDVDLDSLLFFLVGVAILGWMALLFLRNVLHLRLWFIAVLSVCAVGLLLHFAVLSTLV